MQVRVCFCEQAWTIVPSDCKGEFLRIQNVHTIFQALKVQTVAPEVNFMWFEVDMGIAEVSAPWQDHLVRVGSVGSTVIMSHDCWGQTVLLWPSLKRTKRMFLANLQTWFYKCVVVMWTHESSISLVAFPLSWRLMILPFSPMSGLKEFLTLSFSLMFLLDLRKS